MITKYGITFDKAAFDKNLNRLTNQLWKILPMRENEEDWRKQLENVILEIVGLNEICGHSDLFVQLLAKLEGISAEVEMPFELYRRTVFESLSLLQRLKEDNGE